MKLYKNNIYHDCKIKTVVRSMQIAPLDQNIFKTSDHE